MVVPTFVSELLRDTREEVARADSKASLLLASSGVVVGALLAGLIAGRWSPFELNNRIEWMWWLAAGLAAAGLIALGSAVWPRFARRNSPRPSVPSYFGDVATFSDSDALLTALLKSSDEGLTRTADQIWEVSRIVRRKYVLVRFALVLFVVASVLAFTSVVVNTTLR